MRSLQFDLTDDGIMSLAAQIYNSGILTSINAKTTPISEAAKRQMFVGVEEAVILHSTFFQQSLSASAEPWVWVHFVNDGPNTVIVTTDIDATQIWVGPGEHWDIDRRGAEKRVSTIIYKCENIGETATVRFVGQY